MAKQLAASTAEAMRACGKPVVLAIREPLTPAAMEATIALQDEAAARGLATFPSVSRAARALRRLLDHTAR